MLKIFILFFDYLSRLRKVEEVTSYEVFYYLSLRKVYSLLTTFINERPYKAVLSLTGALGVLVAGP